MQHQWVPSTLGHGETVCLRCMCTNREAAALGITDKCDAPNPAAANDDDDHLTDCVFDQDGPEPGEECGRWSNGRLTKSCAKAGMEECDFECPYRDAT